MSDIEHGTLSGYFHHRCRCKICTLTGARYSKRRRHAADNGRSYSVSALGTRRRIRALQAIGWTTGQIATELGYTGFGAISRRIYDAETVTRQTDARMREVYDRLSMTPGASVITRNRAAAKGWPPPLAWDDIDNPNEDPGAREYGAGEGVDDVVVMRAVAGDRIEANSAEKAEIVRKWTSSGRTKQSLTDLQGWCLDRYRAAS